MPGFDPHIPSPLGKAEIKEICVLQLQYLQARLRSQNLELEFTNEAIDKLSEAGFDLVYGASPLKRTIRSHIEDPLAEALLSGRFSPGDKIKVKVEKDKFVFHSSK